MKEISECNREELLIVVDWLEKALQEEKKQHQITKDIYQIIKK